MSNKGMIIPERSRDIGAFMVGRLIPFRKKRMVGSFIFIDHMGPTELGPESYLDVDQHPHIGLATLTYLFEGEIIHRDSLGTEQRIKPGSVNWMVAGAGVVHTERTPPELRDGQKQRLHGYQIWVALPKEWEEGEASFHHVAAADLPQWSQAGLQFKLVAGALDGKESPVPVHSPLYMIEIEASTDSTLDLGALLFGEFGICVVAGAVESQGETIEAGRLLVAKTEAQCSIQVRAGSHLLIFGGEPLPEERFINWNFVASEQAKIDAARKRWQEKAFKMVADDDSYVPLPG